MQSSLREALALLLNGDEAPKGVRSSISDSWRRSARAGLEPRRLDVPYQGDVAGADDPLWVAADPVLTSLATDLEGSRMSLLLSDAGGHVSDRRVSDRALRNRLDRIYLAPGFVYAEDSVGTNAIGTALAQGATSVVLGAEHFADGLVRMACAAAPVRDHATGGVRGVVDVTSFAEDANDLMLPMARHAARQVERRLAEAGGPIERALLGAWAGLTATERSVVELVARGHTNREAAEQLFLSPYTVDFHLRSIFRKLGVRSRVELARLAARWDQIA